MDKKILYVGVSPKPYYGCNYWYVDESGKSQPKTFVIVKMGRHNLEQPAYVDSIKWCSPDQVPYPYERAKRVIRQTTQEESAKAQREWDEYWNSRR